MSSLGNLTNINTVVVQHTHLGLHNYTFGKNALKNGNPLHYQTKDTVTACVAEIYKAIHSLNKLERDEPGNPVDLAIANLKQKAEKLSLRMTNAERNAKYLPILNKINNETKFKEIEEKEAEEIADQLVTISYNNTSSKITKLVLEIYSKLSKFAPKAANNNNAQIVIENPKEEDFGELFIDVPLKEEVLPEEDFGQNLFVDQNPVFNPQDSFNPHLGFDPNVYSNPKKEEISIDNNNNEGIPHQQRSDSLMNDINIALDLVLKAKPDEFAKRLQDFSKEIENFGVDLSKEGIINFEHVLHGQIFDYYTGKSYQTSDVDGVPFARHAIQSGFIAQEELTQCCNNTKTLVYLDILRKLIQDTSINESQLSKRINQIMIELEKHHAQTAWIVFGETSNFGTAQEKIMVQGDFGRNGLVSDQVSRETKLNAVLKTVELRTAQIKKEYEQQ